jgi:hypothetical protein
MFLILEIKFKLLILRYLKIELNIVFYNEKTALNKKRKINKLYQKINKSENEINNNTTCKCRNTHIYHFNFHFCYLLFISLDKIFLIHLFDQY